MCLNYLLRSPCGKQRLHLLHNMIAALSPRSRNSTQGGLRNYQRRTMTSLVSAVSRAVPPARGPQIALLISCFW